MTSMLELYWWYHEDHWPNGSNPVLEKICYQYGAADKQSNLSNKRLHDIEGHIARIIFG